MPMNEIPRRGRPDVTRVLLPDGWHEVEHRSFELDGHSFGFWQRIGIEHGGHAAEARCVTGPLSSVLAVESIPRRDGPDVPAEPIRPPAWP